MNLEKLLLASTRAGLEKLVFDLKKIGPAVDPPARRPR